jgi:hypothetical protein
LHSSPCAPGSHYRTACTAGAPSFDNSAAGGSEISAAKIVEINFSKRLYYWRLLHNYHYSGCRLACIPVTRNAASRHVPAFPSVSVLALLYTVTASAACTTDNTPGTITKSQAIMSSIRALQKGILGKGRYLNDVLFQRLWLFEPCVLCTGLVYGTVVLVQL